MRLGSTKPGLLWAYTGGAPKETPSTVVDSGSLLALSPYQHYTYHYTWTLGIIIGKYIYNLSLAKELCTVQCASMYVVKSTLVSSMVRSSATPAPRL